MFVISFDIGIKNLSYCILNDEKIVGWNNVNIYHKDVQEQAKKIWNLLEGLKEILSEETYIVIEKQMSARMKRIESYIYMYYLDRMFRKENIIDVMLIHAKHKLKFYDKKSNDLPMITKKYSTKYANNKHRGKEQCRVIIHRENEQEAEFIEQYSKSKKKDDLADSFLQGRAYTRIMKSKGKK